MVVTRLNDVITNRGFVISLPDVRASSARKALTNILDACAVIVENLNLHISRGELQESAYLVGATDPTAFRDIEAAVVAINTWRPRILTKVFRSPLEIVSITASYWSGTELEGRDRDDALINMVFREHCSELPLHCHPFSDRVIFVLNGNGHGFFCSKGIAEYDPTAICKVPVRRGDILCYPRTTLHTFAASNQPIELLTYHSKFVPFSDERQYGIASGSWTPRNLGVF